MLASDLQALGFQSGTLLPGLVETARSDDRGVQTTAGAVQQCLGNERRRDQQHRQVGWLRDVCQAAVERATVQAPAFDVNQMDGAAITALDKVPRQPVTQFGGIVRSADNYDAMRRKKWSQGWI